MQSKCQGQMHDKCKANAKQMQANAKGKCVTNAEQRRANAWKQMPRANA